MPIGIITGEPGTTWQNNTEKFRWQYVCELENTCGQCLQFHLQIGPMWPLPLHRACRCRQVALPPGATSEPFADFRKIIEDLPPDQRARVIGSSALTLVESGTIQWGDVVTAGRIRTLHEVIEAKKLSVKAMVKGGLSEARAKLAYASAHTEVVETARRSAKLLAKVLVKQGLSPAEIYKATGQVIASKVGLAAGPGPATGYVLPKPPPRPIAPIKGSVTVKAPDGRLVQFVPEKPLGKTHTVVMVDPAKFDQAHPVNAYYVGPGGVGGIAGRYEEFGRFFAKGKPIEMSLAWLNDKGEVGFENGRHRYAWLRDHGFTEIPMVIEKESAKAFRETFGVNAKPISKSEIKPRAVSAVDRLRTDGIEVAFRKDAHGNEERLPDADVEFVAQAVVAGREKMRKAGVDPIGYSRIKLLDDPTADYVGRAGNEEIRFNIYGMRKSEPFDAENKAALAKGEWPVFATQDLADLAIHESGHMIHHAVTQEQFRAVNKAFKEANELWTQGKSTFPSAYAQENDSEAFAESVVAIVNHHDFRSFVGPLRDVVESIIRPKQGQ